MDETAEEEEIRANAVDVEAETIENDAEYEVESEPASDEERVVIEVPEYEEVR
jgi:hypothetical protein